MDKHELMKAIRDKVVTLEKSPLYEFRLKSKGFPVIGEGSHDAHFMFVGEAPGRNEAATGRPFCGAAGKILDELLASVSIPRSSVYVTNIVKDRPPENRDPLPSEIDIYGPFLDRQIEIIQPKVIVTLGRFSMNYIMQKFDLGFELEPISQAHGKTYQAKASYGDIIIVPQYHPAAAIYTRSLKETLQNDFQILSTLMPKKTL
ncbi:uracil-DNA glycosylase [Candidatus Kaiserbacteria bacterium RIFCSPHIGHO2_01_FULL_49_13]|uniref:Type-4 uracil-DNA glycosylase n=1 Tax=Candidatus Kaiserbacteria bacterium RIFCSPHIGHO2_01_FULL_49_13 TaxID=1798477 RepID=A0A1F6CD48_9BACT|nr:MAG: uracil-DNA glycosylase [Candidatus Kaiserbacteria bacterium RIFCSPHIGHO2_01_FULL_49_13]